MKWDPEIGSHAQIAYSPEWKFWQEFWQMKCKLSINSEEKTRLKTMSKPYNA